ncbi:hypothetical protein EJ04DRAFT_238520 [Polyplosphaeria fusca]|uniref:Uncharacterized protein n=1 Tax=Polyplosphaeria fusca TaxID=682080 RepID=A0A9P4RBY7_9PLEO|nr:hypothetical protein EJ04DRAFT_238520 [Polyplosphaeria fusca]
MKDRIEHVLWNQHSASNSILLTALNFPLLQKSTSTYTKRLLNTCPSNYSATSIGYAFTMSSSSSSEGGIAAKGNRAANFLAILLSLAVLSSSLLALSSGLNGTKTNLLDQVIAFGSTYKEQTNRHDSYRAQESAVHAIKQIELDTLSNESYGECLFRGITATRDVYIQHEVDISQNLELLDKTVAWVHRKCDNIFPAAPRTGTSDTCDPRAKSQATTREIATDKGTIHVKATVFKKWLTHNLFGCAQDERTKDASAFSHKVGEPGFWKPFHFKLDGCDNVPCRLVCSLPKQAADRPRLMSEKDVQKLKHMQLLKFLCGSIYTLDFIEALGPSAICILDLAIVWLLLGFMPVVYMEGKPNGQAPWEALKSWKWSSIVYGALYLVSRIFHLSLQARVLGNKARPLILLITGVLGIAHWLAPNSIFPSGSHLISTCSSLAQLEKGLLPASVVGPTAQAAGPQVLTVGVEKESNEGSTPEADHDLDINMEPETDSEAGQNNLRIINWITDSNSEG